MKRNILAADLVLAATAVLLGLHLKNEWRQYQAQHNLAALNPKADQAQVAAKSPGKSPEVKNYGAIVEDLLFSPDRNNVVIPDDAEPIVNKPKPRPLLTGILGLGSYDLALMLPADAKDSSEYRRLKVGDSISGYTLVKCLDQKVVMSLDGKEVEVPLSEPSKLVAREYTPPETTASTAARTERVTSVADEGAAGNSAQGGSSPAAASKVPAGRDTAPIGTVKDGKVKKSIPSPFGPIVVWVDEK
jgi:hypothetical protein